jgi:hypothetical protein
MAGQIIDLVAGIPDSTEGEFGSLTSGDQRLLDRLAQGERVRVVTPFDYPGRRGPVLVHLIPGEAGAEGPQPVRISDGGALIQSLDEQGLDLCLDLIVSKTVFHAVKEVEGARLAAGELWLESNLAELAMDLWRFLQLVAELLGLRHAKYKDALLHLSCPGERAQDLLNWQIGA